MRSLVLQSCRFCSDKGSIRDSESETSPKESRRPNLESDDDGDQYKYFEDYFTPKKSTIEEKKYRYYEDQISAASVKMNRKPKEETAVEKLRRRNSQSFKDKDGILQRPPDWGWQDEWGPAPGEVGHSEWYKKPEKYMSYKEKEDFMVGARRPHMRGEAPKKQPNEMEMDGLDDIDAAVKGDYERTRGKSYDDMDPFTEKILTAQPEDAFSREALLHHYKWQGVHAREMGGQAHLIAEGRWKRENFTEDEKNEWSIRRVYGDDARFALTKRGDGDFGDDFD